MTVANNQPIELVLTNTTERIDIFVVDANCNAIDATALSLKVYDQGETLILQDDYFAGYGDPATLPTRIVKPAGTTGQYYFPFGDTSFDALNTTAESGEFLFVWKVTGAVGSEPVNIVQVAKVVSPRTMRLVPKLRLIVDKAAKQIDDDPEDPMFLGYTDSMLVQFLEGGLGWINAFQPYPMWDSIDNFPDVHTRVLLDAAVVDALTSQELFAVDTDLNYCFAEGTPVTLENGSTKGVEDVRMGDRVLDRNGQVQVVEAAWEEGVPSNLVEVTLWGGKKMSATVNHEWPVWSWPRHCLCGCGRSVPQGKAFALGHHMRMKERDLVHIRGKQVLPAGYNPIKRLASEDLVPGDFLMMPRKCAVVDTDVTPDEARMLGYYAAEGHPLFRNADPQADYRSLCFTFRTDEEETWVRDIKDYANAHDFEVTVRRDKNAAALYVHMRNDYGRADSVIRLADLARRHVGCGSTTKCLSSELLRWPLSLKLEFVKGLIRGDGHQNWSRVFGAGKAGNSFGVWYSTSSRALAGQVQLLLAQLGYPTTMVIDHAKEGEIRGRKIKSGPCYKLRVVPGFAQQLADVIWEKDSRAHEYPHGARKGWTPPRPECLIDDDFVYIPIKDIQSIQNDKRVYNLTISGDHSYLVDNIATFNSDQGNQFVIDHQPKLSAILNTTWARLVQVVPPMKRHYVRSGSVRVEAGPAFRFQHLLEASPKGALFRNLFVM